MKHTKRVRRLPSCYSSPYGRLHNPNITLKPKIYIGSGAPMNSICAGHTVIGEPELDLKKAKQQIKEAADTELKRRAELKKLEQKDKQN